VTYQYQPQEWDAVTHTLSGERGCVLQVLADGLLRVALYADMVVQMHAGCFTPETDETGAVLCGDKNLARAIATAATVRRVMYQREVLEAMARQAGLDAGALERGWRAALDIMGPQTASWEEALRLAAAVLCAAGGAVPPF
jgi:hypothetical protein